MLDLDAVVQVGVQRLMELQESYRRDRGVGRLAPEALEDWQVGERERLEKLRFEAGPERSEWPYEGVYRVSGVVPSGYRVGGTAIVCLALLAAPGFDGDPLRRAAVDRALEFMLGLLKEDPGLAAGPKRGYDVRGWGHTYALELLLGLLRRGGLDAGRQVELAASAQDLIARLALNQTAAGGWNYASDQNHSPFQTSVTLLALFEASRQDFEVDRAMVEHALDALQAGRDRTTGAFAYSGRGREPMHASAARAAVTELCLHAAGRSDPDDLERAILGFFEGWEQLLARKSQQGTHEGPYRIAPYYFYFGHAYVALAIESLPEARRATYRARLQALILKTRDPDGTWNDRIFPRSAAYGTAMALLALLASEHHTIATWPAPSLTPSAPAKAQGD